MSRKVLPSLTANRPGCLPPDPVCPVGSLKRAVPSPTFLSRDEHPPFLQSSLKLSLFWPFSSKQTSEGQRLSCPTRGEFTGQVVQGHQGSRSRLPGAEKMHLSVRVGCGRLSQEGFLGQVSLEPRSRAVSSGRAGGQSAPDKRTAEQRPLGAARSRQRLMEFRKIRDTNPSDDGCTRRNARRFPTS